MINARAVGRPLSLVVVVFAAGHCANSTDAPPPTGPDAGTEDGSGFNLLDSAADVVVDSSRHAAVYDGYDAAPADYGDAGSLSYVPATPVGLLWGASASDIWGIGSVSIGGGASTGGFPTAAITHYDGTKWSEIVGPNGPGDYTENMGLWGLAADHEIWMVSYYGNVIRGQYTLDGTNQPTVSWSFPFHVDDYNASNYGQIWTNIWPRATDDVWVVGFDSAGESPTAGGLVSHWDGQTYSGPQIISPYGLQSVWSSAPNDVWVGGQFGTLFHWDGSAWTTAGFDVAAEAILSIRGTSAQDVWAGTSEGKLVHFDGDHWSLVSTADSWSPLSNLIVFSDQNIWFADTGQLLHWDGKDWFRTAVIINSDDVFGWRSTLLYGDYNGIWGDSDQNIWVASTRGVAHFP